MSLSAGSRIGVYEIVGPLGSGGMGVVYRARDTRLRRGVALKVLRLGPDDGRSPSNVLLREARAAAALNHPNICTVHEVGEIDGTSFIAMELVAGESLQALLARGRLNTDRVTRIGRQLADALEHAHTNGVVHRDFKSANVVITSDGRAKVLDFGIAARVPEASGTAATETLLDDAVGIAGTLPYMAPEVLHGEPADARSDVWALGVVLHEMASGELPFQGATVSALSAAILRDPPRALGEHVPAALARVISRCLTKEPGERFARAGEVSVALEMTEAGLDVKGLSQPKRTVAQDRRTLAAVGAALAVVAAVLAGWNVWRIRVATPGAEMPVPVQLTHFSTSVRDPAISPDGRHLTFVVQEPNSSTSQVYIMALPDGRPQQLTRGPGTKAWPAFSPDGSRIAYTITGEEWEWDTWVIPTRGATAPQLMLRNANSLRWLKDGRVLFSEFKVASQLGVSISDEGRGNSQDVYVPPLNGMAHYSDVSPDGSQVVIGEMGGSIGTGAGAEQIATRCFVMPLTGGPRRPIGSDTVRCIQLARWSSDGFIYFVSGTPANYQVWREAATGGAPEPVTAGPSLALRGVVPGGFALAPDSASVTYSVGNTQESLWVRASDGSQRQLTFEGNARSPALTADGTKIFYIAEARFRAGAIRERRFDTGEERSLAGGRAALAVWPSPDGRYFVFRTRESDGGTQLWLGTSDNSAAPRLLSGGQSSEGGVVFSTTGSKMYFARRAAAGVALWSLDLVSGEAEKMSESVPRLSVVSLSPDGQWLSVLRTDLTPRETWLYPTVAGRAPRPLYKSWRLEWSPGNRSFLLSNSGMFSTAWSLPNPRGNVLPPAFDGEPTSLKLQGAGARRVLVADFFVDPTPLPEPFSIIYSSVEGPSNLFQVRLRPPSSSEGR